MSQNKYDSKIRSALDEMDEHDISEAMQVKEKVWDSLNVDAKKEKTYNGLIWFVLGLLLALFGLYMKGVILDSKNEPHVLIANVENPKDWEATIERMENKMAEMELKYETKNDMMDSLNLQNQKLQYELQSLASIQSNLGFVKAEIQYVTDTIYVTKVKTEIVEREKILRDTILIEVPIMQNDKNLMTDIGNNLEVTTEINRIKLRDSFKKTKPTSVQFNFKKTKSKKD